jgi:uncharacterized repeat protein (TIGR03803 family)
MKRLKTQLAALLLSTLCLLTAGYGQVIAGRDAATRNKAKPVHSQAAKSGPMVQEQETVLYSFTGADGASPEAGLIRDGDGNLYGTTAFGGLDSSYCQFYCGVVFKLDTAGNETVLYSFTGGADGSAPFGGLVRDDEGNLYGTTTGGGSGSLAAGTVFKLAPPAQAGGTWTETVLHSFCSAANCTDGNTPYVGVARDKGGNLYGTTVGGGEGCPDYGGCGVVFKVDRKGNETVLYSFCPAGEYFNCADGNLPNAVIQDAAGNLYGTTDYGGSSGSGVVFKLAPPAQEGGAWTETVLYSFTGGTDGGQPVASVIQDAAGNLYGTTSGGGDSGCSLIGTGCGVVFKLAPPAQEGGAWTETVLYSFTGGTDGGYPVGGVIQDAADNLYGTTLFGGLDSSYCSFYCGVVFKLDATGNETALYSFTGLADGNNPYSGLILDPAGNLYGTTGYGGDFSGTFCQGNTGCGVVFKVASAGVSVSPPSLNFGNVGLGYRAKQVVTLENEGVDPVEIGPITFTAITGDLSQFSDHVYCPSNLGAGKSCTIAVIFTPDAVGADAATLNIVTSAPGSPIEVPIAAAGIEKGK